MQIYAFGRSLNVASSFAFKVHTSISQEFYAFKNTPVKGTPGPPVSFENFILLSNSVKLALQPN
jgi:hypothetical protein